MLEGSNVIDYLFFKQAKNELNVRPNIHEAMLRDD